MLGYVAFSLIEDALGNVPECFMSAIERMIDEMKCQGYASKTIQEYSGSVRRLVSLIASKAATHGRFKTSQWNGFNPHWTGLLTFSRSSVSLFRLPTRWALWLVLGVFHFSWTRWADQPPVGARLVLGVSLRLRSR